MMGGVSGGPPVPFLTNFDPARRLFLITPDGDSDFFDGIAALRTVAADPRRPGCAGVLADMRSLKYVASHAEVHAFAGHIGALGALPFAVVVNAGVQRGVANQLAAYAGLRGGRVGVFTDPAAAATWLAAGGPAD
jgi:hypothetical protein